MRRAPSCAAAEASLPGSDPETASSLACRGDREHTSRRPRSENNNQSFCFSVSKQVSIFNLFCVFLLAHQHTRVHDSHVVVGVQYTFFISTSSPNSTSFGIVCFLEQTEQNHAYFRKNFFRTFENKHTLPGVPGQQNDGLCSRMARPVRLRLPTVVHECVRGIRVQDAKRSYKNIINACK